MRQFSFHFVRFCAVCLVFWLGMGTLLSAQTIWIEDFNYSFPATTGGNNNTANPAPDWTSSCLTCTTGDHFEVTNGAMEGNDTNGPGILETEVIDISAYPAGVEVTVSLEEQGDMEGCPGGVSSGCNSVDWIRIEYKLDNGAYQDASSPQGGICNGPCAGATYVTLDDFAAFQFSLCPLIGNTLQLRISVQCWANSEYLRFDDLVVQAQTCDPLIAQDSLIAVRCNDGNDGEIWVLATGPGQPFEYRLDNGSWQSANSFTGLPAGTYDVYVRNTSGDIVALQNLVITQPNPIFFADSLIQPQCLTPNSGEIYVLDVINGTPPYDYRINGGLYQASNAFTGLGIGAYQVEVRDNNGCIANDSVFLFQSAGFTVTTAPDQVICAGLESAQLFATVTGGTAPYTYAWWCDPTGNPNVCDLDSIGDDDPLASPLTSTYYIVSVTDSNGCSSANDTIWVEVEEPFEHPLPEDVEFCPGEPIVFGVDSLPGFSYSWLPTVGLTDATASFTGASPLESVICTLTITLDSLQSGACRTQSSEVSLNADNCLLPNVFTPNGDGINDNLQIGGFFNRIELFVYDRWGVQVYLDTDYANDWNGVNKNGGNLKPGVYYYFLKSDWFDPDNDEEVVKSYQVGQHVTLIR